MQKAKAEATTRANESANQTFLPKKNPPCPPDTLGSPLVFGQKMCPRLSVM